MLFPYERFLRFLVTRRADVNKIITKYGLPPVGGLWPHQYRSYLREHAPSSLIAYLDNEDGKLNFREGILDWVDHEGFGDLWRFQAEFDGGEPPPDVNIAFQIFINPMSRGTLGLLLFSEATSSEIYSTVQEKLSVDLTPEALETYKRLFWDISLVSRDHWPTLIRSLGASERTFLAAGINGQSADEVRSTLELPVRRSPDEILANIASKAYKRFEDAVDQANPEVSNAHMWANLAVKASAALKNRGRHPVEESKPVTGENMESLFSVEITESNHVTLSELQGQFVKPATGGG